jgi:hypothetical protein
MTHILSQPRYETCPAQGVRWHEFAEIFPWMEGETLHRLVKDIWENGVIEPIVMLDGAILDGRNRYMLARDLGIPYPVVEYEGDDPLGFVLSKNLTRRHLTESQRAVVASKLAKLPRGGDRRSNQSANLHFGPVTSADAAEMLNVSERSVNSARAVRERSPELAAKVESGALSVSLAEKVARLPDEDRAPVIDAPAAKTKVVAREAVRRASLRDTTSDTEPLVDLADDLGGRTSEDSARVGKFLSILRTTAKRLNAERLEDVLPLLSPKEAEEIRDLTGRIGAFCRKIEASRAENENAAPAQVREPAHA